MFGGAHVPIFLVTVFTKNEKDNLGKAEQGLEGLVGQGLLHVSSFRMTPQ